MFRLLSIGFILILLYQSAGFIVTFELGVSAIRKELKENLIQKGEGSIVRLSFHKLSPINFKDDGKEIYYQNNMYDILRHEVKGDSLIFTCFHDIAESKLVADFEQEVKAITDQEQSENKNDKSVHKKYEYIQGIVNHSPTLSVIHLEENTRSFKSRLVNTYLVILSPPPEVS